MSPYISAQEERAMYAAAGGYEDQVYSSAGMTDPVYYSATAHDMCLSGAHMDPVYPSSVAGLEPMYSSAVVAAEEDMMYGEPFSARGEYHDDYVSDRAGRGFYENRGMYDAARDDFVAPYMNPEAHSSGFPREIYEDEYLGMEDTRADGQMRGIFRDDYSRLGTGLTEGFEDGLPQPEIDGPWLKQDNESMRSRGFR